MQSPRQKVQARGADHQPEEIASTSDRIGQWDISYALWHELRQFITQAELNLDQQRPEGSYLLARIKGQYLTSRQPKARLPEKLIKFCEHSAAYLESRAGHVTWGTAGSAIRGIGLERLLIANELWQRSTQTTLLSSWEQDISGILSFFSQTSQRRYEKAPAQLTVEYDPLNSSQENYGRLGKPLLDEYRALLRLCRDAHTRLVVKEGLIIVGLDADSNHSGSIGIGIPLPPQLLHLQQRALQGRDLVIFNLNQDGSQDILNQDGPAFRFTNGVWRLLLTHDALKVIEETMGTSGQESVARNALMLALDLAHSGEGALIFLCDEPTDQVLERLLHRGDGLIKRALNVPAQELTVRARFTQLVGNRNISLHEVPYNSISPLLRDLCGIDGCTVFSYGGELLGFGCLVRQQPGKEETGAYEGARTTAAKLASDKGIALKVSSDGTASLFYKGQNWGVVW